MKIALYHTEEGNFAICEDGNPDNVLMTMDFKGDLEVWPVEDKLDIGTGCLTVLAHNVVELEIGDEDDGE
jgi:hypothetical protein